MRMEKKSLEAVQEFSPKGFVRRRVWQSAHLHCNIYCFEPGQQNSLHRHPVADEVAFCWEGEEIIVVGEDHSPIKAARLACACRCAAWLPQYQSESPHDHYGRPVPAPVEHVPVGPGDLTAVLNARGVART